MHADRFDIMNKKLAKDAGSIRARKVRQPLVERLGALAGGPLHCATDDYLIFTGENLQTFLVDKSTLHA